MQFQVSFFSNYELKDFTNCIPEPTANIEKTIVARLPVDEYWSAQKIANKLGKKNNSYFRAALARLKQQGLIAHDTKRGYRKNLPV